MRKIDEKRQSSRGGAVFPDRPLPFTLPKGATLEGLTDRRLRRYAGALTRNRDEADDLVQETTLTAVSKLHLWQPGTDFRAWLFTLMHNQHINDIRRQARKRRIFTDADSEPGYSGNQLASLELRDVAVALSQLPPSQSSIILLVGLDGVSYAKVAQVLGIPIGTVRSRLSRARTALRRRVDGRDDSADQDQAKRMAADATCAAMSRPGFLTGHRTDLVH